MTSKITLITPPDFYENGNQSILFMGLTESQQDTVSKWLADNPIYPDINIYFYMGEPNIPWLFYALNRSETSYLNCDAQHAIITWLSSFILSKPGVYFSSQDENVKALMTHINQNYVPDVEIFLEKVFNDKR